MLSSRRDQGCDHRCFVTITPHKYSGCGPCSHRTPAELAHWQSILSLLSSFENPQACWRWDQQTVLRDARRPEALVDSSARQSQLSAKLEPQLCFHLKMSQRPKAVPFGTRMFNVVLQLRNKYLNLKWSESLSLEVGREGKLYVRIDFLWPGPEYLPSLQGSCKEISILAAMQGAGSTAVPPLF